MEDTQLFINEAATILDALEYETAENQELQA